MAGLKPLVAELPVFDRKFWDGTFCCTQIGAGSLGGKASGLVFIKDLLSQEIDSNAFPDVDINVPAMAVMASDCFDQFIAQNDLATLPFEEMPDDRIAHAFQKGDLPAKLLGDLRALTVQVKSPLAIRSSGLLEDALERPFAGVYATKMIPNNQFDPDTRFRRLVEAIKFVYASTYFREARDYIRTTGREPGEEKMAVIIQEVVGQRREDRFYPDLAGVARSYNFYAFEPARPDEGVVTLAMGLGKTIVDGGTAWTFSPAYPKKPPPFASVQELLKGTQTEFWAVNMGKPPAYDPVSETEYLVQSNLADVEAEALSFLASTYDPERDRVIPGIGARGPRILNFAPTLVQEEFPLNELVRALLKAAENAVHAKVEIEFALTLPERRSERPRARLGFLQVRPMVVSDQLVDVTVEDLSDTRAIRRVGHGDGQRDVRGDTGHRLRAAGTLLSPADTLAIAQHLESINRATPGTASAVPADRIRALGQLPSVAGHSGGLEPDLRSAGNRRGDAAGDECRAESGLAFFPQSVELSTRVISWCDTTASLQLIGIG